MIEVALGIILAIIILLCLPWIIGILGITIAFIFIVAIIGGAFYIHPVLGAIVLILFLWNYLDFSIGSTKSPTYSTESPTGSTKREQVKKINPLSILSYKEQLSIKVNNFVLKIQPVFTEDQKINKLVNLNEHKRETENLIHNATLKKKRKEEEWENNEYIKIRTKLNNAVNKLEKKLNKYEFIKYSSLQDKLFVSINTNEGEVFCKYSLTSDLKKYKYGYEEKYELKNEISDKDIEIFQNAKAATNCLKKILRQDIAAFLSNSEN